MIETFSLDDRQDLYRQNVAATLPSCPRVMIAVDGSHLSQKAIPHGVAIANALGSNIALMRVLEPSIDNGGLTDPVEWQLLRRRAQGHIEALAERQNCTRDCITTHIQEGRPSDQICQWAKDNKVGLVVVCSQGSRGLKNNELGRTARRVMECALNSVLLVPSRSEHQEQVQYRHILVPLDGSSRAESALPMALQLAKAQRAELLLAHAVPMPELTEIGPLEPNDLELRDKLMQRNERVGRNYLNRVRKQLIGQGVPVSIVLLSGSDPRHLLVRAISEKNADFVIMAAQGHSGHADVPFGSVAAHMISHSPVPLLLVKKSFKKGEFEHISRNGGFMKKMQPFSKAAA